MQLELDEVRRLTGPNLIWDKPGAIVDVLFSDIDANKVLSCWMRWAQRFLKDFGWNPEVQHRFYEGGASFVLAANMDELYTACELAELAWDCAAAELQHSVLPDWQGRLYELKSELAEEKNAALLVLMDAANKHQVTCISDDDEVSLGMGASVDVWPARSLPDPQSIDWAKYSDIPRAFITGTNGKSTSVRLAAQIAKCAGINAGVTSTDFIKVGDEIIDTGDYSGPGGARMLLRDKRTEMAFLEVARGGILRRGIPVESVDAALITNVAADHLGQYGINTVEELAQTKFVVAKGLQGIGCLVVNADNKLVVEQAKVMHAPLCWYSMDENNPLIQNHIKANKPAVFVRNDSITYMAGNGNSSEEANIIEVLPLSDIAMTMNGKAAHNVQNALGVVGLCMALKLPLQAIKQGLKSFGSSPADNPGRGNIYKVKGATVIVDFAHNEHSMRAIVNTANLLPHKHKFAMFSHAGDRSDKEIRDLTLAVAGFNADAYAIAELEVYLRGRELGDIPAIAQACLLEQGVSPAQIKVTDTPLNAAKLLIEQASEDDLLLLFVLSDREQVHDYLMSQI
ncbi:Mur ligase family protein [Ningiella sp. W23]|uniref:Mur ligase family protein n=1 Tax=Ningiella sp. W23 TaxID=3023715 RepID=UPI003756603A